MSASERRRSILFLSVCAALAGSALAFAVGGNELGAPRTVPRAGDAGVTVGADATDAAARAELRLQREVRAAARGFLAAFLPYEAGQLGPRVARALRTHATPAFAHQMLARPPGPPPPDLLAAAKVGRVAVTFVSALPPRAVISGAVDRGSFTERFSFVFERRGSNWLASGAGD